MNRSGMAWGVALALLASAACPQPRAEAAAYPDRPVKFIIPWAAGGDGRAQRDSDDLDVTAQRREGLGTEAAHVHHVAGPEPPREMVRQGVDVVLGGAGVQGGER